ncbi:MAG: sigma-70 family RNA polymerase sigma factor [Oribacterium sp.]|nr:sigma-70 family RNA polymerase sigma factor [Oribacterium sp.]MBO6309090.1 sigma-70 family RNA polymerase sigma factor [Oribacterium sp.]
MKKKRKSVSAEKKLESQFDHFAKNTIKNVILNVLQEYVKHEDRIHLVNIDDYEDLAAPEVAPDFEKVAVTLGSTKVLFENELLASGIAKLKSKHRQILEYAYVFDMPDQAIADLMNLKKQSIRNYKHRAYEILRKYMEDADE